MSLFILADGSNLTAIMYTGYRLDLAEAVYKSCCLKKVNKISMPSHMVSGFISRIRQKVLITSVRLDNDDVEYVVTCNMRVYPRKEIKT